MRLPPDAFDYYFGLGPGRSYDAVARQFGVSKRSVTKRAAREGWRERLSRIDERARRASDERAQDSLEAMSSRHLKMIRAVQAKAIQALREIPLTSGMDAVRAVDLAIRQERLIRGEPSDRTALSIEDLVRHEHERWLGEQESGDDEERA